MCLWVGGCGLKNDSARIVNQKVGLLLKKTRCYCDAQIKQEWNHLKLAKFAKFASFARTVASASNIPIKDLLKTMALNIEANDLIS
jgi:hypothetical protein